MVVSSLFLFLFFSEKYGKCEFLRILEAEKWQFSDKFGRISRCVTFGHFFEKNRNKNKLDTTIYGHKTWHIIQSLTKTWAMVTLEMTSFHS